MRNKHNRSCELHVPADKVFNGDEKLMQIMSRSLVVECKYNPMKDSFQYLLYSDLLPNRGKGEQILMTFEEVLSYLGSSPTK